MGINRYYIISDQLNILVFTDNINILEKHLSTYTTSFVSSEKQNFYSLFSLNLDTKQVKKIIKENKILNNYVKINEPKLRIV